MPPQIQLKPVKTVEIEPESAVPGSDVAAEARAVVHCVVAVREMPARRPRRQLASQRALERPQPGRARRIDDAVKQRGDA